MLTTLTTETFNYISARRTQSLARFPSHTYYRFTKLLKKDGIVPENAFPWSSRSLSRVSRDSCDGIVPDRALKSSCKSYRLVNVDSLDDNVPDSVLLFRAR